MSKLGINGFGRIGRLVLRRLLEVDSSLEVVAINDLTSPKVLAYLLKHDSNYGPFPWSVDFTEDALIVDGKKRIRPVRSGKHFRRQLNGFITYILWNEWGVEGK